MPQKHTIRLLLLLLLYSPLTFSQAYENYRINYGLDEGLPSLQCYEILKDSRGYIWFGTEKGVVKYNGYEFRTFTTADGLNNNENFNLFEDQRGGIWCYDKTNQLYCIRENHVYPYPYNYKLQEKLKNQILPIDFHFDDNACLFLSLKDFNKGNALTSISNTGDLSMIELDSFDLYINRRENNTTFTGFWFYNDNNRYRANAHSVQYESKNTSKVLELPFNRPSDYKWVYRFQEYDSTLYFNLENRLYSVNENDEFKLLCKFDKGIIELEVDREGNIYVGLTDDGLWMIPMGDITRRKQLMNNCSVSSVFIERSGGYWVSTLDKGIFHFPSKSVYRHLKSIGDNIKFIAGNQESIVSCTREGQIKKFPDNTTLFAMPNVSYVNNLVALNTGGYLVAVGGTNAYYYPKTNEHPLYKEIGANYWSLNKNQLYGISVNRLTVTNEKFLDSLQIIYESEIPLNCFTLKDSSTFLLGTNNGIFKLTDKKLNFWSAPWSVYQKEITDIAYFDSTTLLTSTIGNGLIVHKNKTAPFCITENDGLVSNDLDKLHCYKNYVFATSNKGLSVLKKADSTNAFSLINYTINNGLPSNHVNDVYTRNDTAYVATTKGIIKFNLEHKNSASYHVPIYLTSFVVSGKEVEIDNKAFMLTSQNDEIEVSFEAISLEMEGQAVYRYRLQGLESKWTKTKSRSIRFSNLPAGEFKFEISVLTGIRQWTKPISLFSIKKSAPFWQQTWFFLSVIIFLALISLLMLTRSLKKRKQKSSIQKTIIDLERKALQAQMNPHFIFNSLTSIQSLISQDEKEKAETFVVTFSRLIRTALDQSSNNRFVSLEAEIELLTNYIQLESLRFSKVFAYSFNIDVQIDPEDCQIPPMILQPFIENSIEHGLMRLKHSGYLKISIHPYDDELLECIIVDNGIGRRRSNREFKKNGHESKGVKLIEDRLKILNKKASVTMSDLDINNEDCGTKVSILMPFEKIGE